MLAIYMGNNDKPHNRIAIIRVAIRTAIDDPIVVCLCPRVILRAEKLKVAMITI